MDLYFLRHGIAAKRERADDFSRPLTAKGRKKMKEIARGMRALKLSFDLILSSPALRAKQTADRVAETLKMKKKLKLTAALLPDGDPEVLVKALNEAPPGVESVLLVGHEPFLSSLVSMLTSGGANLRLDLKKGGLCKLIVEKLHYGRCAALCWLLTPRLGMRLTPCDRPKKG